MTTQANGYYDIKGWDEKTWDGKPWNEVKGAKLTHAVVTFGFHGDIEGECKFHMLSSYRDDGTAKFVGLQQMTGKIGDRAGSFVMQVDGSYDNGEAKSTWTIIPGSSTGDLTGIKGE